MEALAPAADGALADRARRLAEQIRAGAIDVLVREVPAALAELVAAAGPSGVLDAARALALEAVASVYNAGRHAEAVGLSRLYLLVDPGNAAALSILGFAGNRMGDPAAALRPLARAFAVDPGADRVRHILGMLASSVSHEAADAYWSGDPGRAEALFRGLLDAFPGDPLSRAGAAMAAGARHDPAFRPTGGALPRLMGMAGRGSRPVWAVVIGIIRDEGEFRLIVRWLATLRRMGILDGIVLSTWIGEVSRRPALAAELAALGVVTREAEEPRVRIKWNTIQQMVALQNGLDLCPPGSWVLKVRTDQVYGRLYERFAYNALAYRDDPPMASGGPLLQRRIAILDASLAVPFYIHDLMFFGLKEDIAILMNFDLRYLFCYRSMISEQWFFSRPFPTEFPIFDTFFRLQPGHPNSHALSAAWFRAMLGDAFFLDVLASYLLALSKYFRIGIFGQNAALHETAVPLLQDIPAAQALAHPGFVGYRHLVNNDYWIAPLLRGGFAPDAFGRRLREALDRAAAPDFQQGYGRPESLERPEVRAFATLAARLAAEARGRGEAWATSEETVRLPDLWRSV